MRFLVGLAFLPIRLLVVWPVRVIWRLSVWLVVAAIVIGGWAVLLALLV